MHLIPRQPRLLVALALLIPISAQAKSREEEAEAHYKHGLELLREKRPADAVIEFLRSYEIRPDFGVLYALGLSYFRQNPPLAVEAVKAFELYLQKGGTSISERDRVEIGQTVADLKKRIATLEIHGAPDGASIYVDDQFIGKAPPGEPVSVSIGTHVIVVTPKDQKPIRTIVTVAGEDYRIVQFAPTMEPKSDEGTPSPPVSKSQLSAPQNDTSAVPVEGGVPAKEPALSREPAIQRTASTAEEDPGTVAPVTGRAKRIAGFVTAGVGVGSLAAGVVLGLYSRSRNQSAIDSCPKAPCSERANVLESDARDFAKSANILFAVGGALVVTGAVLYVWSLFDQPSPQKQARLLLFAGHGSLGLATGGSW